MANTPFDPFGDRKPTDNDDFGDVAQNILRELKNASDIVLDAAQASKDELLRAVGEGIGTARQAAREARRSASSAARQFYTEDFKAAEQDFARQRQQRKEAAAQEENKRKKQLRPVSKGANFLLVPTAFFYTPASILLLMTIGGALSGDLSAGIPIVGSAFLAAGTPTLAISIGKKRKEKLYTRYLDTIGTRPSVNLRYLAAEMKRSYDKCVSDLRDMVERGYFGPDARVDVSRGELIIDQAAADLLKAESERQQQEAVEKAKAQTSDSYDAMLAELQHLNVLIEDEEMSEMITRIETVARATFLAVRQTPEKISSLRRFMDYYLPTTIKLLRAYAGFERSAVEGDNIRRSKENIEGMMKTLCEAFEKQYDSLFLTETLDINAEIRTMDSLLRQDGFVGGANFSSAAAAAEEKKS